MEIGIVTLPTDKSAPITDLAAAIEARGLASLYVGGDHTHIPVRRTTPFPGGGELPDEYTRTVDPIVALAAAAVSTNKIRLGTAIYLTAQRYPIDTAKKVASLDFLAGGRIDFGVGYGWNVEEADDHGVTWTTRRALVRDQVLAMKALWTEDEAEYHGKHLSFDKAWMRPKPASRPHPRVLVGASPGPRSFGAIAEWGDGWFPVPFWGHSPADARRLGQIASEAGRDPRELAIIVDGVLTDPSMLDPWHEFGAEAALVALPSEPLDIVLPLLDAAAALIERYR
ncbi:MAG: TIGR03619 family F420-dependent LLM class oxidoreductase [Actinobacteria bacterium]|nr:MAG: TIGR03619 family F420-dependent LLM class oxidoreductase [Actinomycetota bacterium]